MRRATWSQPSGVPRMKPTRDRQGTECRMRARWSVKRPTIFDSDREASSGTIGDVPGAADGSDCNAGRPSSRSAKGASGSAGRHRSHDQPLCWWLRPYHRSPEPAGCLDQTMWRSCFPAETTTMPCVKGGSVLQNFVGGGATFRRFMTAFKVPNWTPMARRPAPAAVRGRGERVTCA